MNRYSHSAGRSAAPRASDNPRFSPFRHRLVVASVLAALAAYWFLFVMGGTFDPAKREALKNTVSGRKASPPVFKNKTPAQNKKPAYLHQIRVSERNVLDGRKCDKRNF